MNPLTTLVRSLGNRGALANAEREVRRRERDEWLVQGLAVRLERREAAAIAAAPERTAAVA